HCSGVNQYLSVEITECYSPRCASAYNCLYARGVFMDVFSRTLSCVKFTVATAFALSTLTPSLYAAETLYQQHNLVSDQAGQADHTDANLVNAWGLALNPNGPVWIANNGTGTSTLYDGNGVPFPPSRPLVVNIPVSATDSSPGNPTGMVFNNNN